MSQNKQIYFKLSNIDNRIILPSIILTAQNRTKTDQDTQKGSEKGSEKSSERGSGKGSKKTRDRIVCEMKDNTSVTINELATMLSISDRAVSKHLKKLQEEGIIRRVGADRGGYWEVMDQPS